MKIENKAFRNFQAYSLAMSPKKIIFFLNFTYLGLLRLVFGEMN